MGSITWGTGTDIFAVDYLDAQVPETGNNAYHSTDFSSHMLSALELKRMSSHYEAGISTSTDDVTPQNAPLSLKQEGVTPGYYRTFHYRSHPADGYFFSQNILMYDRHIITNVSDIQRLVWKPTINQYTRTNVTMVDGSTQTFSYYQISQFEPSKMSILKKDSTTEYTATGIDIVPAIISPDTANALQCFNYWDRNIEEGNYVDRVYRRYNQTYGTGSDNVARYAPTFNNGDDIILPNVASLTSLWAFDDTNNYVMRLYYKANDQYSYLWTSTCEVKYWVKTDDELCHVLARSGVKFEFNGVIYKPLAENGVIVGYTDDMDEESEWDNWHDYNDHEVPITPPVPPTPSGDDDDYADMGLGVGANVGGLTNYAIMSIRDLATLLADFNEHLETGMSIQNNFVCLYKLGPLSSFLCNTSVRAIVMSANAEANFVSVDDYSVVTGQKAQHYFGSYDVPRFTNTFYDFSPYSTYELFIPCCGWVPLPDTVAGRKIDVYLVFDLASCTCKGIVKISGTTIAEVSGVLGASVPFYMIEHGMERLAQVTAITQTLSSLAVGAVGAGSGNAGVAAYGLSQLTQGLNDLNVSGNTNFTAIKGGNGDMSAMGNGEYCTIKITHPVIDEVVNNSMFGHSVGYLCNTIGELSSFTGFTVCGNPHVTFSASAEERDEIERLLSMGVIL